MNIQLVPDREQIFLPLVRSLPNLVKRNIVYCTVRNKDGKRQYRFNPLNAELNPICHLLALLGAHHIFHVSGLRVNVTLTAEL